MRVDPSHIRDQLRHLGGGAADAARGQRTALDAERLQDESQFESIDRLLLKRMRVAITADAADSAIAFADAQELLERTTQLMGGRPDIAQLAHDSLARRNLHSLLDDR